MGTIEADRAGRGARARPLAQRRGAAKIHAMRALVVSLVVLASAVPARALACGASGPGGVGVAGCSLEEHAEATRAHWRVGAGYAFTSTAIRLSGDRRADEVRHSAAATLDYRPTSRVTIQLGVGAVLGGSIDARHDVDPGFAAIAGVSWRAVDATGARPFVLLGAQLAASATTTHERAPNASAVGYEAFDLRLGAASGWVIARTLSAYAIARAFGGPIFWRVAGEAVTGTDVYHYQLGAGLAVVLARAFDLYVEGVALGERGVTAGLGWSF